MHLFIFILDILFPPREAELLVRNARPDELLMVYRPRTYHTRRMVVTALLPYHEPLVQACVTETKFRNNKKAQQMLGVVLLRHAEHLLTLSAPLKLQIVLVPVPLGRKRRQERGYNQVERVAIHTQNLVPTETRVLKRIRETLPQTTLDGQKRRHNVRDAFGVASPPNPAYLYIVVDDVLTTGSTLHAAGRALAAGGARPISLLALAH